MPTAQDIGGRSTLFRKHARIDQMTLYQLTGILGLVGGYKFHHLAMFRTGTRFRSTAQTPALIVLKRVGNDGKQH